MGVAVEGRGCYGTVRISAYWCAMSGCHCWGVMVGCGLPACQCRVPLAGRCAIAGCDIGAMVWCLGAILGGLHVWTHFSITY